MIQLPCWCAAYCVILKMCQVQLHCWCVADGGSVNVTVVTVMSVCCKLLQRQCHRYNCHVGVLHTVVVSMSQSNCHVGVLQTVVV